ncbi:CpaF family protein [Massilia aerilata]|uniref:CpaF family protein n=1 Tax=Massilia aerilata TaxID=453817 RepID=A0ABW0S007_9BURK
MLKIDEIQAVLADQLRPVKPYLERNDVTELMINPGGHVYVEAKGVITYEGQLLTSTAIDMALTAVAKFVGQDALAGSKSALVGASIEDMRIAGAKAPTCPDGSFLTIRKHQDKGDRPTLERLIEMKALTAEQAEKLVDLIIRQRLNCIVAGATGSGKTTLLNALLSRIPPNERLVTIEDSREMQLAVPNVINLLSNPSNDIHARDLVQLAMRLRPDRLILGETRGHETYDLIRAFNSGHPGSVSTIHADSAEQALDALEMLYQMSLPANASMPPDLVRRYIAKSVHLVVFAGRRNVPNGEVTNVVRRIEQICLVKGVENGEYVFENVI